MSGAELSVFIKKNPISVGCGALALLLALGLYFRAAELPAAEATLAEKSAEVERHGANLKYAAQLKEQLETLVTANKEIDSRIISFGERGLNIQFFNKLEARTGVKMLTYAQGSLITTKGTKPIFNPISFNVSVSGTWPQLVDFLQNLESGERYCRIISANIATVGGKRNGPLTLNLTLELLGRP